jgi:tryptophan-rich sensory protein
MSDSPHRPGRGKSLLGLIAWLAACFAAPALGAPFAPGEWYAALQKPAWNPPAWIFGPVWMALYTMMACSAWLVWRRGGFAAQGRALTLFLVQLALNAAWTPLFFGLRQPGLAFAEIVLLWLALAATIRAFLPASRAAAWLLAPYLAWVSFAAALNFTLWRLNSRPAPLFMIEAIQTNLLSPAVLFFVLGVIAALTKSDLKFPEPLYVGLTIYLLVAIGFKGGVAISEAGLAKVWLPAVAAMLLGALIPLWTYPVLRFGGKLPGVDAAAIAAHYGSVSAVTFIAATNYLHAVQQPFENYATAFLAVMESPAILVGVVLGKLAMKKSGEDSAASLRTAAHEALFGRSIFLLVGALIVGALSGPAGMKKVEPFFVGPFQGVLALFLLEMGLVAGRRLGDLRKVGAFLLGFGIVVPLVNGALGVLLGQATGLSAGGAALLGVLAASASYIAAPAAIRLSLPEANPTLYLTSSLAITFPFNITLGIPLYLALARALQP